MRGGEDHYIDVRLKKLLKYSGRLPVKLFPPKPLGRGDDEEREEKWKVEMEAAVSYIPVILVSFERVGGMVPERLRPAK